MGPEVGDKVRLKSELHAGERGIIVDVEDEHLVVQTTEADKVVVSESEVTNLSLAARKAWKSMPDREVGRPKGFRLCDRVSVTLRIDRELWEEFRRLESEGVIEDRTATINAWIRESMGKLKTTGNVDGESDD